jgi:hypothetical protein
VCRSLNNRIVPGTSFVKGATSERRRFYDVDPARLHHQPTFQRIVHRVTIPNSRTIRHLLIRSNVSARHWMIDGHLMDCDHAEMAQPAVAAQIGRVLTERLRALG